MISDTQNQNANAEWSPHFACRSCVSHCPNNRGGYCSRRSHTTGPGFGFATASFSQHGRLETHRRADRARAVHKAAGTFANVPGAQGVDGCRSPSDHCTAVLARTAALRHGGEACLDFKDSQCFSRCSRLAARSRPTTRSTRGSWRGLTHDLCYPSAGPAAVSQRASFLAPSCLLAAHE